MKTIILTGTLLATLYSPMLLGASGESLVFDPVSGDYTITYADNLGNLQQSKFVPRTKIEPVVSSVFKLNDNGNIDYRYTIANGKGAKQSIRSAGIYNISSLYYSQPLPPYTSPGETLESGLAALRIWDAPIVTPDRWQGHAAPDPDHASLFRANWSIFAEEYPNEKHIGVTPDEKQAGFGFVSSDLPGIGKFKLRGYAPIGEGYVDEGPRFDSEVGKQLHVLEKNNFVLHNAAVPTISIPTPFDPAVVLERIQTHTHTWIAMQLLDPAFSTQLDRYFQAAISAYRLNQPKVGKKQIQTMRVLIKKEQPGADKEDDSDDKGDNDKTKPERALIDKLAARVLDFDLKYVTKRIGEDKGD